MSSKQDRLSPKALSGYDRLYDGQWEAIELYNNGYKQYLDAGKTERDCVDESVFQAEAHGFVAYTPGMPVTPGAKYYVRRLNKSVIFAIVGKRGLDSGLRMMASHIDSPRLDLKPNPLYEDSGLALLKTHYYGGVKKYQWMSLPLELRGVVYTAGGEEVRVSIGSEPEDPVLVISDLLPHFAADQMKKSVTEAFPAEGLNVLIGSRPDEEECDARVKLRVLSLLHEKYGICESDLLTAELCLVPAGNARDVGLDRAMIGGYGHDDRCCSYAGLRALFDISEPEYTAVCLLADKEEIGSEGVTGMQSAFFDGFIEDLCAGQGVALRHCYANSFCLSGDVCTAFDPNFPEAYEKMNQAKLGYGVGICKYTGRAGKGGASDAAAETMQQLRQMLEKNRVFWQVTELGKVDKGGGGTVACYLAKRNIEVVDCGVPVLSMHSPFEIISKLDNYMAYRAILAVYSDQ